MFDNISLYYTGFGVLSTLVCDDVEYGHMHILVMALIGGVEMRIATYEIQ